MPKPDQYQIRVAQSDCPGEHGCVDVYRGDEPYITGIPLSVAQEFVNHPGQYTEVFQDVPRLRAIALEKEVLWRLQQD